MNKNTNAIDKIINELARKDFLAMNPLNKDGLRKYSTHRPYSLSMETLEAVEIRKQYVRDLITEEEYKAYCLKYNLTHNEREN